MFAWPEGWRWLFGQVPDPEPVPKDPLIVDLRSRTCPDCEVEWVARDVHCWICGRIV